MKLLPETFLREFVLPLISGGELHIGRPLDAEDLARLEAELVSPTQETVAVERARAEHAAELWLYPVWTQLDRHALELLVALHNLLFLSHPVAKRWWRRDKSVAKVEAFSLACLERCPVPAGGAQLVSRHALLGNLPELTRTDVEIKFWAGKRTYRGQDPPKRLMRWKGLRGVRAHRQQVSWIDTELSDGQQQILGRLMSHSPLTDLLTPTRLLPTFEWLPAAAHLTDPHVCRLVCHRYLELGLDRVGPALAEAFWNLVNNQPGQERRLALQLVGGLVIYLYALTAMTHQDEEKRPFDTFDPAEPESSLLVVLMAAAGCGLLPSPERLGDNIVHMKLVNWASEPSDALGTTAGEMAQRLGAALAA